MPRIKKKFEDTTGAIRRLKSMKDRQYTKQWSTKHYTEK